MNQDTAKLRKTFPKNTRVLLHGIQSNISISGVLRDITTQTLIITLDTAFIPNIKSLLIEIPNRDRSLTITMKGFVRDSIRRSTKSTVVIEINQITRHNQSKLNQFIEANNSQYFIGA